MSVLQESSTKYPLMIDKVAKSIFKNNEIGKEYTSRIISAIYMKTMKIFTKTLNLLVKKYLFLPRLLILNQILC